MNRRATLAFALLAALLAGCSSLGSNVLSTGAPESGDAAYATSPANIASLTDVVTRNPKDPQAYNMRGSVFGQAHPYEEAPADFNKALTLDPNYAQAYANRALIYRETGKLDGALADYDKALQIDPSYSNAYLGRGMAYRAEHQPMPALHDFNKAIAIRPDSAQAYYNRGLLYQAQNQHNFAIEDFTTAIGLSTNEAGPYIARGLSYMAVKNYKDAASDLDDAVNIDPQNLQAWIAEVRVVRVPGVVVAARQLLGRSDARRARDVDVDVVLVFGIVDHRVRVRPATRLHIGEVLRVVDVGDVEDAKSTDAVAAHDLARRVLAAVEPRRWRLGGDEEQVVVHGHVALRRRAERGIAQLGRGRVGDVPDLEAVVVALDHVCPVECEVGVRDPGEALRRRRVRDLAQVPDRLARVLESGFEADARIGRRRGEERGRHVGPGLHR